MTASPEYRKTRQSWKAKIVMDKGMQNPYPPEGKGTRVGVGVQISYPSQTPTLEEGICNK